uniref:Uncharacterized protein n=1 Tax=Brassica campestris TaxID=3711 RepID=M4D0Z8_BRACM
MKSIAPYVPIPRTGDIGGSSTQKSDGVMMQDTQQSSGKRIASLIVTPSRQALDDNVTKRPRVSPHLLTFSPTEEVLPVDAQVIGALNDMEITSNSAGRLNDADKSEDRNGDDLLGEDLMDMEADIVKRTEKDERNDKGVLERSKPSSSSTRGGKRRAPLGLLGKKAEFLRRGSPKLRRSSSRDTSHSQRHRSDEPGLTDFAVVRQQTKDKPDAENISGIGFSLLVSLEVHKRLPLRQITLFLSRSPYIILPLPLDVASVKRTDL